MAREYANLGRPLDLPEDRAMIIGAYGTFWERELVDWKSSQLLGRRGSQRKTLEVVDFRLARGVYVLYDELGIYYAGLAAGSAGIGGRLKDHLTDRHGGLWTRFSWFAFDSPSDTPGEDGIFSVDRWSGVDVKDTVLIRDMEALLIAAMRPAANRSKTQFAEAESWTQVATKVPSVKHIDDFRHLLS